MIVIVGDTRSRKNIARLQSIGWGRMFGGPTAHPTPYPNEPWGFDNGAFAAWRKGQRLDESLFLTRLAVAQSRGTPYLAVCPDLPAEGEKSLSYSLAWREKLPDWPWYLAVQDGMTPAMVLPYIELFTGLFLGGTLRFKSTAPDWILLARQYHKKFHFARCGTLFRLEYAVSLGADSIDSTTPLWEEPRLLAFIDHVSHGSPQYPLFSAKEQNLYEKIWDKTTKSS